MLDNYFGSNKAAPSLLLTGQVSHFWQDELDSGRLESEDIGLGLRMEIHGLVHRRGHENRAAHGQVKGGQEVIGDSTGQLGDDVGRGRSDDQKRDFLGQRDVGNPVRVVIAEEVDRGLLAGEGAEQAGRDELGGVRSHDDLDIEAFFLETTQDFAGLVDADGGGDAQGNLLHGSSHPLPRKLFRMGPRLFLRAARRARRQRKMDSSSRPAVSRRSLTTT